jgi:spoIIIJ-associated protein
MKTEDIRNLIKDLIEKTTVSIRDIKIEEENPKSVWIRIEVAEPHLFTSREGEGLSALNHLIHRMIEAKSGVAKDEGETMAGLGILVDINDFQKKRVESVRAIAHMMSERARYFKSSIEIEPMSAFDRRIVHEFLANATDLKTESTGVGRARRVVIKYIGSI